MPSNADLIKAASELAAELTEKLGEPVEVATEGLSNAQLNELVSGLRAQLKDAEPQDPAAEAAEAKAAVQAAKAAEAKKKPPYYMAPRKSLTSKRGILSGDTEDEVKAEYLAGGQAALDAFVASGHVLKG